MIPADGFGSDRKVTPFRVTGGGRTDWGTVIPEQKIKLPEALFSPGATSEDILLSEQVNQQAVLRWPRQKVVVEPENTIEIDGQRWQVHGFPKVWPLGTTVVVRRYK